MVKQCGPDRHPATACRKCSKGYSKMAILCYLQPKEGLNIGYERECISTERTLDCLSWRNNTWHAKLGVF